MGDVPEVLVWDCPECETRGLPDGPRCVSCDALQPPGVALYPPDGSSGEELLLGLWDCPSCEGVGIRGDVYGCPNCGAGRPPEVRFYLPEDAERITDAAAQAAARAGADWQCEYCDQWVGAGIDGCPYCDGGELSGAKRQEVKDVVTSPPQSVVESAAAEGPGEAEEKPEGGGACCFLIVALLLLAGCCLFFFRGSPAVGVEVSGHAWTRTQEFEVLREIEEGGWSSPADATQVRSEKRVHHHDQVQTGTRRGTRQVSEKVEVGEERYQDGTKTVDMGNGRFKQVPVYKKRPVYEERKRDVPFEEAVYEKVPRYQLYYTYRVKRWAVARTERSSGDDLEPAWPELRVEDPSTERGGKRTESYEVRLKQKEAGTTLRFSCPEERWRSLSVGSIWQARVDGDQVTELLPPKQ